MKNLPKGTLTAIGFVLFVLGFAALSLMVVGVNFSFLTWVDAAGKLPGLVLRVAMVIGGIMLVVIDRTDWKGRSMS
jgi:hypothetical protein